MHAKKLVPQAMQETETQPSYLTTTVFFNMALTVLEMTGIPITGIPGFFNFFGYIDVFLICKMEP